MDDFLGKSWRIVAPKLRFDAFVHEKALESHHGVRSRADVRGERLVENGKVYAHDVLVLINLGAAAFAQQHP